LNHHSKLVVVAVLGHCCYLIGLLHVSHLFLRLVNALKKVTGDEKVELVLLASFVSRRQILFHMGTRMGEARHTNQMRLLQVELHQQLVQGLQKRWALTE